MSTKKMILVSSSRMDKNNKRDENDLVRMSKFVREISSFKKESIEIDSGNKKPVVLKIFKAYTEDLKWAKENYDPEDLKRIVFVTSDTLRRITGKNDFCSVWVSEDTEKIMIGADPEFIIKNKNGTEIVHAYSVLPAVGEMGSDGAMGEIRPFPCPDPLSLCSNIENIFKNDKYKELLEKYLLVAGCYESNQNRDFPIGGHIHVGNHVGVVGKSIEERKMIYRTLNKIMDELIAVPLSRLDFGETGYKRRAECKMSPNGGYGYFGEFRLAKNQEDPEGSLRLEHRTLSGMWLIHPTVTRAVMGVAKLVIDSFWDLMEQNKFSTDFAYPSKYKNSNIWKPGFDKWEQFPVCRDMSCILSSDDMISLLNARKNTNITKAFVKKWANKMRHLPHYEKYKDFVDLLAEILYIPIKDIENYDRTIQKNWLEKNKFIID